MPKGKRIAHVRADSAAYQVVLFNWDQVHKVTVAIGGCTAYSRVAAIAAIPDTQWQAYQDRPGPSSRHARTPGTGDQETRAPLLCSPLRLGSFFPPG